MEQAQSRGCVVQQIEHVQEQLNAAQPTKEDCSRNAHVKQPLRRQPARPSRLEQDALIALRQRSLPGRGPRLPADALQIGCKRKARSRARALTCGSHARMLATCPK